MQGVSKAAAKLLSRNDRFQPTGLGRRFDRGCRARWSAVRGVQDIVCGGAACGMRRVIGPIGPIRPIGPIGSGFPVASAVEIGPIRPIGRIGHRTPDTKQQTTTPRAVRW